MNFLLKYHYLLENPLVSRENDIIYIKDNKKRYVYQEINNLEEFNAIINIIETNDIRNYYSKVKKTNKNIPYTIYQNKPYALIELTKEPKHILEVLLNNNISISNVEKQYAHLNRYNWYFLWANKNDHFMNLYRKELPTELTEMFDYYIGIAESALQYLSEVEQYNLQNKKLQLVHNRVEPQNMLNPVNMVLDKKERDIAEYLKYIFNTNEFTNEKMQIIVSFIKKENLVIEYIFARLLYPTDFFDYFETIDNNKNIEKVKCIDVANIDKFEEFLKMIYKSFSKIKKIKKIDWL